MSNEQAALQHVRILERPPWMFWVNRKAAFQSLGDMGETANEQAIDALANVLCDPKTRKKWKYEASVALIRIGPTAVFVLPRLRQSLMDLDDDKSDFAEIAELLLVPITAMGGVELLGELLCQPTLSLYVQLVVVAKINDMDATPALPWLLKFLKIMDHGEADCAVKYEIYTRVIKAIGAMGNDAKAATKDLVDIIEDLSMSTTPSMSCLRHEICSVLYNLYPHWRKNHGQTWTDATDIPNEFLKWWKAEGKNQVTNQKGSTHMSTESARKAREWWQSPASAKSRARGYAICDEIDCGAHIPPDEGHIRKNPLAALAGLDMPPEIVCDQHEPV